MRLIEGYEEDCYQFLAKIDHGSARYLSKVPKKYKYICSDTVDFVNACYCLAPDDPCNNDECEPTTLFIPETTTTETTTTTELTTTTTTEPTTTTTTETDSTTTTTTETDSTTTTTTETTTEPTMTTTTTTTTDQTCPTSPATCDNGFTCSEGNQFCGTGQTCLCYQTPEGDNFCGLIVPCSGAQNFNASADCPAGQRCARDTCCGTICIAPATNEQCDAASE